jgi:hypothetical protein
LFLIIEHGVVAVEEVEAEDPGVVTWSMHELDVAHSFVLLSFIPGISWDDEIISGDLEMNVRNFLMLLLGAFTDGK